MSNTIKIKRSATTASPAQLSNGELAWTESGNVLFIGSYNGSTNIPIAGARFPGTLTANQALVANSTSYLDVIKTANLYIGSVSVNTINNIANSTVLGLAANNELASTWAIKTYVDAKALAGGNVSAGGTNTQIQFNDSSNFGGSAGFTFDKTTNIVFVANTLTVGSNISLSTVALTIGNSTVNSVSNSVGWSLNGGTVLANALGVWVGANVNLGLSGLSVGNTTVNTLITSTALAFNTVTAVNSTSFVMGAFTANTLLVNAAAINITGQVNTATFFATTSANVGANVQLTTVALKAGNTTVNSTVNSVALAFNGTVVANSTQLTYGSGVINSTAISGFSTLSVQDATVAGNLNVTGTLTTIDATNLTVKDPLIMLADQQSNTGTFTDTFDTGFYALSGNTSQIVYSGLFRDASDSGVYKLFSGQIPAPTTTVDTTNVNFAFAKLQSYLKTGTGTGVFEANSSGVTITANSTWSVSLTANTLSLSTALPVGSGGTGLSSVPAQYLLVGGGGSTLSTLAPTDGGFVMANSTQVYYGAADGGTF